MNKFLIAVTAVSTLSIGLIAYYETKRLRLVAKANKAFNEELANQLGKPAVK